MKGSSWLFAFLLGVGITLLQFLAVAALNEVSAPEKDPSVPDTSPPPIVLTSPPKTEKTVPQTSTVLRTMQPKPMASSARAEASALPALRLSQTKLGLGSLLPNLGGVGVGNVDLSEVPSEADRPARVHRTVEPTYPISAQRQGIEGYVILRLNIDANGKVKAVFVVDSEPMGIFERSARDAARRFEFTPARLRGASVPTTIEKKIVFSLQ